MRKLNAGGSNGQSGKLVFFATNQLNVGASISGTYLRTILAGKKAKKEVYIVRLSAPIEYQGDLIPVGTDVGINTDGLLAKYMPEVQTGTDIKLVYLGKVELKNGNTPHSWDIFAADPSDQALPA